MLALVLILTQTNIQHIYVECCFGSDMSQVLVLILILTHRGLDLEPICWF